MQIAEDYRAIITEANQLVFLIQAQSGIPNNARLVFNNSKNALLYRSPHNMLLLDNLPDKIALMLKYATEVLVIETNFPSNETIYDYKVKVYHTT